MMEKRNFVTSVRTPGGTGASDIDDVIDAGMRAMKPRSSQMSKMSKMSKAAGTDEFAKKASIEDEKTDGMV